MYDYIIIGAGPTGLTLAWYLAKYNNKILIIDRESDIGGCHRVRRIDGLFTEHGPRIIVSNYFGLEAILADMNLKFDDLFVPYNVSMNTYIYEMIRIFQLREMRIFALEFIKFLFDETPTKNINLEEFMLGHNFQSESMAYVDRLCRVTDGGTIQNYTLFEFLQIFNQNFFYRMFQPKVPNDVGLFAFWSESLKRTGLVDIMLETEVVSIHSSSQVNRIRIRNKSGSYDIRARTYIFAIPPKPMVQILTQSLNPNLFGPIDKLTQLEIQSRYLSYISSIFHWDRKFALETAVDFPESAYGIVYVIQSDYTDFANPKSQTVIVCSVTKADSISNYNNKTANQCTKSELITEVFRQLRLFQPSLTNPTYSLLSPGIYRNNLTDKFETLDSAYFLTKAGYISNKSIFDNLYWVGTHNGNSLYSFTAMESAIENAVSLLHDLVPVSKSKVLIHQPFTVKKMIIILIFVLVLAVIYVYKKSKNKS